MTRTRIWMIMSRTNSDTLHVVGQLSFSVTSTSVADLRLCGVKLNNWVFWVTGLLSSNITLTSVWRITGKVIRTTIMLITYARA